MDNPIILLAFWFVVNLVMKSAKDKKNIEEARRKKSKQLDNRPIQNKNLSNATKNKSIIDVFKEEIEKEIQREKEKQLEKMPQSNKEQRPTSGNTVYTANSSINETKTQEVVSRKVVESNPEKVKVIKEDPYAQENKVKINMKNDVLKGIIFSEILSEPKGIKHFRRSI